MTRRLFLHIGMYKTGSTAIQVSLRDYDDGTTAYLKLAHRNHSYGMVTLFCPERAALNLSKGSAWGSSLAEQELIRNDARLCAEAQAAGSRKHMIVSGEDMSDKFGATEIDRLRAFFLPHFDEIRVIAYLRQPHAYMVSALQEVLKFGPCRFATPPYPEYRRRLGPWEDAFGRAAMDYALYPPEASAGRDVVADFALRVGLPPDQVKSRRANESMSAEAFAMLYRLRNGPRPSKLTWPDERLWRVAKRYREFGSLRFALAESVWPKLTAAQEADIAWAEERIGQSFPAEPPKPDAVIFRSEAEVMDFAAAHEAECLAWSKRIMPWRDVLRVRFLGAVAGN